MTTNTLMKLDDAMLGTISGGHGHHHGCRKHERPEYSVRQSNSQSFSAGDITITVEGNLSGNVFIGNSASNSVSL